MVFKSFLFTLCLSLTIFFNPIFLNKGMATETPKPTVRPLLILVPMTNKCRNQLTWDPSEKLYEIISHRLTRNKELYVIQDPKELSFVKTSAHLKDPFGQDVSWIKRKFNQTEFIVFLELIQHDEVLTLKGKSVEESPAELNLKVAVRAFDLRGESPKVILEELVQHFAHIPKSFAHLYNGKQPDIKEDAFDISPFGIAYTQLSKEIATQIESYILMASSS